MALLTPVGDRELAASHSLEEMDIDMDLDFTIDPSYDDTEAEVLQTNPVDYTMTTEPKAAPVAMTDDFLQPDAEIRPERIHIRGLDSLSNDEVKAFAAEHYPTDDFVKVEWINDTSANIVYRTADATIEALRALTLAQGTSADLDPLQLRPAKKLSTHPLTSLVIRLATTVDVKKKNAYDESRYYLLHPDQDPRERKRKLEPRRPRFRRGSDEDDYRRPRYDDRENRKRRLDDVFSASMYDEGPSTMSDTDVGQRKRTRFGRAREDLYGGRLDRQTGRLRDRSASPRRLHDGDGRFGFGIDGDASSGRRIRTRSPSPQRLRQASNAGKELFPEKTNTGKELFPFRANAGKELFPEKSNAGKELFPAHSNGAPSYSSADTASRDLFADKLSSNRLSRELFPNKTERSNHRRTEAVDHSPQSSVDLINGMNGFAEPRSRNLADRISGPRPSLADRISGGTSLADRITDGTGLNIRGAASADEISVLGAANPGFSIRGAAATQEGRDVFPLKTGVGYNTGKDLFAEKIRGRGGPRRKAEDMY